ncbi:hypothetical protein ABPG75_002917 [Micractinium tetrahymenae]
MAARRHGRPPIALLDLPGPALDLILAGVQGADRVALASCSRELRRLAEGNDPSPWASMQLAVPVAALGAAIHEWRIHATSASDQEEPPSSLLTWLGARQGVLCDLQLHLTDAGEGALLGRPSAQPLRRRFRCASAVVGRAVDCVAEACAGGALTSLRISTAGADEEDGFEVADSALALLPHLRRLALHSDARQTSDAGICLPGLSSLTSLVVDVPGFVLFSLLHLPACLRHLAVPFSSGLQWIGWPVSLASGIRLRSLHLDVSFEDDRLPWHESHEHNLEEEEGEGALAHRLGLDTLHGMLPRLAALSIHLPQEDADDGFPMDLSDACHLTTLRALAVRHLPPAQAATLSTVTVLTYLHLSNSPAHPLQQLPAEIASLAALQRLHFEGARNVVDLGPLLALSQLSALALPACRIRKQAVQQLLKLPALRVRG